jgi:hypothetical protein
MRSLDPGHTLFVVISAILPIPSIDAVIATAKGLSLN